MMDGPGPSTSWWWWRLLAATTIILSSAGRTSSLKILNVKVPDSVKTSGNVRLECHFDLEGDTLYSVTWWRGPKQFYSFSPSQGKNKYDAAGIDVDKARSNEHTVVLRNVTLQTSGKYKCEVLADYPTFEKDSQSKNMSVIDFPDSDPLLLVPKYVYTKGEDLEANCTSPGASPKPELLWRINGVKVGVPYVQSFPGKSFFGLYSPTSWLRLPLHQTHFINGQLQLECWAVIPRAYNMSSVAIITRKDFKTVAPSQKLYGAGSAAGGSLPLVLGALAFLLTK